MIVMKHLSSTICLAFKFTIHEFPPPKKKDLFTQIFHNLLFTLVWLGQIQAVLTFASNVGVQRVHHQCTLGVQTAALPPISPPPPQACVSASPAGHGSGHESPGTSASRRPDLGHQRNGQAADHLGSISVWARNRAS